MTLRWRFVLDSNIYVIGLYQPSPERELLRAWRYDRFDLFTSLKQINELRAVSKKSLIRANIHQAKFDRLIERMRSEAIVLRPINVQRFVPDDPSDDYIVAIAVAAGAHVLATNDRHLHRLRQLAGNTPTRILRPQEALDLL